MIRGFATAARRPVVEGGCPIMNAAIEADDTNPALRDRARESMTRWHRMIGRIVKDGIAEGTLRPGTDPYDLASYLTAALEGGLMLARLYDDPAHMDRVVAHLVAHVQTLRADPPEEDR
jgi:AcrR family transcriptional regulator